MDRRAFLGAAATVSTAGCLRLQASERENKTTSTSPTSGTTRAPGGGQSDLDGETTTESVLGRDALAKQWEVSSILWEILPLDGRFYYTDYGESGPKIVGRDAVTGNRSFESVSLDDRFHSYLDSGSFAVDAETFYLGTLSEDDNDGPPLFARLYAIDRTDGSIRFTVDTPDDGKHSRIPQVATVPDGPVVFGTDSGGSGDEQDPLLVAVDPASGKREWSVAPSESGFVMGLGVVDGTIYVANNQSIVEIDPTRGKRLGTIDLGSFFGFTIQDDLLVTTGETIRAYDTARDTVAWSVSTPGGGDVRVPVTISGETVYAATETGYVLSIDLASGTTNWTTRIRGGLRSNAYSPAVGSSVLWVSDDTGRISVLMADSGTEAFTLESSMKNDDHARPVEIIDDVVLVGGYQPIAYRVAASHSHTNG
ncbi:MAG: PQQ-binding-like beta-propeller repeat protein [Halodesulfurarchaeum sp.]